MSVLLLFPKCPIHSSDPQVAFGDPPSGNLAAPPVPSAGAAFSLRGRYGGPPVASSCTASPDTREESRAPLLAETVSVLLGLWIAECVLLFVFMGYVQ
jgi:hypothetical protein